MTACTMHQFLDIQEQFNAQGKNYISSDVVGKAGLESTYEDYLQGTRGEQKVFIDSTGKVLSTVSEKDSTEGNDVYLTIDSKLQKATYKLLEKKIASILILMKMPKQTMTFITFLLRKFIHSLWLIML